MIETLAICIMALVLLYGVTGLLVVIFRGSPADRATRIERLKRLRSASTKLRRKSH